MQTCNRDGKTRLTFGCLLAFFLVGAPFISSASAQQSPRRLITKCWQDIIRIDWNSDGIIYPVMDGITLRFDPAQARFVVRRGSRTIYTFQVPDLSSDAEFLWSPDGRAFALNYSDGGAIGNFHVRVFLLDRDTVTEVSRAIAPAVSAFKARHFCKARGNNVTALKWLLDSRNLVLMTEVYPTGDCGPDLGHAEGYIVAVPDGKIERHFTLDQLKNLPGVCLQNEAQ